MKILDRTIIRNFLVNLILWCLVLCGLIVVSDLLTHFEDFFGKNCQRNPVIAIFQYYGYFCARIADSFLPFILLISALNIVINMIRRNEVIALMSIGVSPGRIILPILITSLFLSAGAFWLREIFVPGRIISVTGNHEYFTTPTPTVPVKGIEDEWTGISIGGESIDGDGRQINRPTFKLPSLPFTEDIKITAEKGIYQSQNGNWPDGYLLSGVDGNRDFLRKGSIDINGNVRGETPTLPVVATDSLTPSEMGDSTGAESDARDEEITLGGRPGFDENNILVFTPADYPDRLKEDECFIACGIPADFLAVGQDEWKSYTSTARLLDAVKGGSLPIKRNDLLLRIHSRVLKPVTDIFPLFLGLPFLFVYKNGNPYKRGAFAALLAGLYIGAGYAALFLFSSYPAPILRVWLPFLIFFPVATLLFHDLKNS